VLFFSQATNLVMGATNEFYWRDLQTKTTYALAGSVVAAMTPDGSNVLFGSGSQIMLWKSQTHTSTSLGTTTSAVTDVAISPDGTRGAAGNSTRTYTANLTNHTITQLALSSRVSSQARFQFSVNNGFLANLIKPASGNNQIYLYNFQTASNTLISQPYLTGSVLNGNCDSPTVSANGRYVAYRSFATNLVPNDANSATDIFLYDSQTTATTLISVSTLGNRPANSRSLNPVFSGDGQTLFFQGFASDIADHDFNQGSDIFALPLSGSSIVGETNSAPPLQFSEFSLGGGNSQVQTNQGPTLNWVAVPGVQYQVQFKNNLGVSQWQNLNARPTIVGSQGQATDLAPDPTQRFYRIISQ
jgi:hypothetical protein